MSRSIFPPSPLDNFVVILVEPSEPGNLGASARAMMNMGLSRLRLVGGCDPTDPACQALAGKAYPIIQAAPQYADWDSAVTDIAILVGTTSARERLMERPVVSAREAATWLVVEHPCQKVGLVFGPERTGLNDRQLARCQILTSIPAHPSHPVLNLAQAVMVVCYEWYQAAVSVEPAAPVAGAATQEQRSQMLAQAERLLTRIGFLSVSNPEHMLSVIRNMLRADLTAREVRIARGILSQIEWFIEQGHELPAEQIRKK